MDFGVLDGLICSDNKHLDSKWLGSGGLKQDNEEDWKLAKTTQDHHFSKPPIMLQQQQQQHRSTNTNTTTSLYSADSHNMLSFSSPNSHHFSHFAPNTTTTTTTTTGLGYGVCGVIAAGVGGGVKGPFTPSQWMELEHQALIYKYITLNAPIPSNLLIPIRKAIESATHLRQYPSYGWGGFHLGFSNSSDPEPGRCRRTDGKKWRCSRDAVTDQKYCERHMNRGRHRSRKPVEGQTTTTKVSPSAPLVTTTSTSTIVSHLQRHKLTTASTPAAYSHHSRSFLNKESVKFQDSNTSIGVKESPSEFGLVCSDSLLNPLHKNENEVEKSQNALRQFMDDWPHTQLSISIPVPIPMGSASSSSCSSSDFMSASSSSPISERVNLSPLRMGMKVSDQRSSWIPVCWENSMGGPLGEVLNHNNNNSPSMSALNLMTDGWENGQHHMTLSPTGVLQKTVFASVSNSSAGSSPRTDNNNLLIASSLPLL